MKQIYKKMASSGLLYPLVLLVKETYTSHGALLE
jgi:hypothetical protein